MRSKISGPKMDTISDQFRTLRNEEFRDLYRPVAIMRKMKTRTLTRVG